LTWEERKTIIVEKGNSQEKGALDLGQEGSSKKKKRILEREQKLRLMQEEEVT